MFHSIDVGSHHVAGDDAIPRSCAGALGDRRGSVPYSAAAAALLKAGGSYVGAFDSACMWRMDEADAEGLNKAKVV